MPALRSVRNFGVHRFYLGDVAWGIGYLVFFWTGIPGLIALWILALLPLLAIVLVISLIFIGGQIEFILSEIGAEI